MGSQRRQGGSRKAVRQDETPAPPAASGATQERAGKVRAALDDLIDEIDQTLEDNAEEFVAAYVQQGGQ